MKHAVLIGANFLNKVELHSVGGWVIIKKVSGQSINVNNVLGVLKVNVIETTYPFDFLYIVTFCGLRRIIVHFVLPILSHILY